MLAQANYRCIAAFERNNMVGVSGFWTDTLLWAGQYLEPEHVVVDEHFRSRGIETQLLAWLETEAMRLGCDVTMVAMILGKDRNRNFYRRNGYADAELIPSKTLSAWADAEYPEYAAQKVAAGLARKATF